MPVIELCNKGLKRSVVIEVVFRLDHNINICHVQTIPIKAELVDIHKIVLRLAPDQAQVIQLFLCADLGRQAVYANNLRISCISFTQYYRKTDGVMVLNCEAGGINAGNKFHSIC